MTSETENRRTESARRNDDSDLIDEGPPTPETVGRSGGNLQRDVATADPEKDVRDPDAADNLTKEQKLEAGESSKSDVNAQT